MNKIINNIDANLKLLTGKTGSLKASVEVLTEHIRDEHNILVITGDKLSSLLKVIKEKHGNDPTMEHLISFIEDYNETSSS